MTRFLSRLLVRFRERPPLPLLPLPLPLLLLLLPRVFLCLIIAQTEAVSNILKQCYGDPDQVTEELVECILTPGLESGAVKVRKAARCLGSAVKAGVVSYHGPVGPR